MRKIRTEKNEKILSFILHLIIEVKPPCFCDFRVPTPKSLLLPRRHKVSKFHKEYIVINQYFVKLSVLVALWHF